MRPVPHSLKSVRPLTLAVALAWPLAALMILVGWQGGDVDPTASRYGQDWPGDLAFELRRSAIEAALLVVVVRPWSFARSRWRRWRLVLALVLFLPWTLLGLMTGLHSGPSRHYHDLWLMIVCMGLLIALVATRRQPEQGAGESPG
jgi:peptidoglycan/LPS O-acetylase OafA/YrhL